MESVKTKRFFSGSARGAESNIKPQGSRGEKGTAKGKNKTSAIRSAYDMGYARGWEDAYDIPKRIGAKTAAAHGYKRGAKNRVKSDKYIQQYERGGKK